MCITVEDVHYLPGFTSPVNNIFTDLHFFKFSKFDMSLLIKFCQEMFELFSEIYDNFSTIYYTDANQILSEMY